MAIIHPKVRGFICTTTHPKGCELNVRDQIEATRKLGVREDGPKKVLVIGASSGYGLAARITAAFGFKADTLGVFFENQALRPKLAPLAGTTPQPSTNSPRPRAFTASRSTVMPSLTKPAPRSSS